MMGSLLVPPPPLQMPPVRERAWKAPVPPKEVSAVGGERVGGVPAIPSVAPTPAYTFVRKISPGGDTAVDEQAGDGYHAEWGATFRIPQRIMQAYMHICKYLACIPLNKSARSQQWETKNRPSDLNKACLAAKSSLIRTTQTDHEIQADAQDSQD